MGFSRQAVPKSYHIVTCLHIGEFGRLITCMTPTGTNRQQSSKSTTTFPAKQLNDDRIVWRRGLSGNRTVAIVVR